MRTLSAISRRSPVAVAIAAAVMVLALTFLSACSRSPEQPPVKVFGPDTSQSPNGQARDEQFPDVSPLAASCPGLESAPSLVSGVGDVPAESETGPVERALEAFEQAFAGGRYEEALACAEAASQLDPKEPAAHQSRAVALDALGYWDEAHIAYERMIALNPDDAESLRAAADFHLRTGGVDALETAILYARRGRDTAESLSLAAELSAMEAEAANLLGRPADALRAAEAALVLDPNEPVGATERAIALFELLRFEESRKAFKVVLARSAKSPRALWYAGLLREQQGRDAEAERLFRKASRLDPEAFPMPLRLDDRRFQEVVDEVWGSLVDEGTVIEEIRVRIEELPQVEELERGPDLSPTIGALYRVSTPVLDGDSASVSESDSQLPEDAVAANPVDAVVVDGADDGIADVADDGVAEIVLFRRNLLRTVISEKELRDVIRAEIRAALRRASVPAGRGS